MQDQLNEYSETLAPLIVDYGMNILGAIVILIAGYLVAKWAARKTQSWGKKSGKVDDTLVPILSQLAKAFVLIVTLLAVLGQFGVETTSIVAVLGASALAVGLALQGTLSNVASGVMLLTLRPFRVGDVVEVGGTLGVVDEVGLFTTEMHSLDNIGISIPNSAVWGSEIKNLSRFDTRRVDMVVGIGYGDDMDKAMNIIRDILDKDTRVLKEPAPAIAVSNLGDSSVDITVRPWAKSADYWGLKFDFTKKVKERFDAENISIPFPQRDIHVFNEN